MNILSIQSHVVYGHVGNAAAVFPLQRLGFEVWPVNTVSFSNHLGYPTWRGRARTPEELTELIDGLEALGILGRCDAVLTGYLGKAATAEVILDALRRVRAANPNALYLCDPVMGDLHGGLFVASDIPAVFAARLLPAADIIAPNAFELEHLSGIDTTTLKSALAAADRLRGASPGGRPGAVVATSIERRDGPAGMLEVLAVDAAGAWLAATPKLPLHAHGTGDAFAALLLGHYLRLRRLDDAVARATAAMHAIVEATVAADAYELRLIAAQQHFDADPARVVLNRVR